MMRLMRSVAKRPLTMSSSRPDVNRGRRRWGSRERSIPLSPAAGRSVDAILRRPPDRSTAVVPAHHSKPKKNGMCSESARRKACFAENGMSTAKTTNTSAPAGARAGEKSHGHRRTKQNAGRDHEAGRPHDGHGVVVAAGQLHRPTHEVEQHRHRSEEPPGRDEPRRRRRTPVRMRRRRTDADASTTSPAAIRIVSRAARPVANFTKSSPPARTALTSSRGATPRSTAAHAANAIAPATW